MNYSKELIIIIKLRSCLFFFLFSLVLLGCSSSKKENKKIALNINISEEPATLDPRKGADLGSSALHFLLFEGLTKISPTKAYDLALAEKIEISSDKLTYTFTLKEAQWSNGDPMTAYDFEYSWKSMLDPSFPCPNAHLLYPIKMAEEVKRGLAPLDSLGIGTTAVITSVGETCKKLTMALPFDCRDASGTS